MNTLTINEVINTGLTTSERNAVDRAARHIVTSGAPIIVLRGLLDAIERYCERSRAPVGAVYEAIFFEIDNRCVKCE